MTIEDRIEDAQKMTSKDGVLGVRYVFTESELDDLLQQVAKEKREQFEAAIIQATGSTELLETIYNIMPELKED